MSARDGRSKPRVERSELKAQRADAGHGLELDAPLRPAPEPEPRRASRKPRNTSALVASSAGQGRQPKRRTPIQPKPGVTRPSGRYAPSGDELETGLVSARNQVALETATGLVTTRISERPPDNGGDKAAHSRGRARGPAERSDRLGIIRSKGLDRSLAQLPLELARQVWPLELEVRLRVHARIQALWNADKPRQARELTDAQERECLAIRRAFMKGRQLPLFAHPLDALWGAP
jgi:hypothetical protein